MKNMPSWMTNQEWVMTQHESLTREAQKARLLASDNASAGGRHVRLVLMLALALLGAMAWWLF
jgi:hypothetical protein